jgi:hypothetical protein
MMKPWKRPPTSRISTRPRLKIDYRFGNKALQGIALQGFLYRLQTAALTGGLLVCFGGTDSCYNQSKECNLPDFKYYVKYLHRLRKSVLQEQTLIIQSWL